MKPKSQASKILSDLQEGRRITPIYALAQYGCFRLAARINDLRESGYPIATEIVTDQRTSKSYAEYYLTN